jgi:hypothetical protein
MSTPAEILDEALATVAPLLTAAGYKKSGRNFVALGDGVARIVQFQTSQLKKPDEASFTINLLATSVAFFEAYADGPFPKNAASAEPVVRVGIGGLLPEGEAIWWSLEPRVSSALIAKEVAALLEERAIPFLARFESDDALLKELESDGDLPGYSAMRERCRAVLLAKNGRKAEARKVLAALVEANSAEGLEGFRDSVNQLAKRLGV